MNKFSEFLGLLFISVLLAGCANTPKSIVHQLNKDARIGVVAFMGNIATMYDKSFFSGYLSNMELSNFSYDRVIAQDIVIRLHQLGYKNSEIINVPENNPITNLSRMGAFLTFSSTHSKIISYLKEAIGNARYSAIIMIEPNYSNWGRVIETNKHFRYGIDYEPSVFASKHIVNFAAYDIKIVNGNLEGDLAGKYGDIQMESASKTWPKTLSPKSEVVLELRSWLKKYVVDQITNETLALLRV